VAGFTSTLTWTNPLFNWTNPGVAASIDHTQGFTVMWTGGNAGTDVVIGGTSTAPVAGITGFTCRVPVEAGTFTVPPYILLDMPAGNGGVNVQSSIAGTLTATGLDQGVAGGVIAFNVPATYK
jgi:hypothetical protein